jgi:hypothetical protein
MKHLAVLDFSTCKVEIFKINEDMDDDAVLDFLLEKGYRESEIQWMYGKLTIAIEL